MADRQAGSATAAFAAVTVLFFAWGFITSLVDPLVAAVKGVFTLTTFEANAATFAFFIAYGVASLPAAWLLARVRSVPTILIALGLMIAGCLIMLVAANLAVFGVVLAGLFVLASGITVLQVAANPLAVDAGVDMFDSVLPARVARNGSLWVPDGRLNLRNARFLDDPRPVQEGCRCRLCRSFSRAYLAHLFRAGELLASRLATCHNLTFTLDFMASMRSALRAGTFPRLKQSLRASEAGTKGAETADEGRVQSA